MARAKEGRAGSNTMPPPPSEPDMANSKPLMAKSSGTDHANAVQSALRTLDAEGSGISAIASALQSDLGTAFASAADLIRNAKGRLIVTGLGKSRHLGRKIAATFASTGTPAVFVHPPAPRPRAPRLIPPPHRLTFPRGLPARRPGSPITPRGARMSGALVEMSSKGFGCVRIADARGAIVGIVPDGDLRRHIRTALMTALVDAVMTKNPKT